MNLLDLIEAVDVDKTYLQLGNRLHDRLSQDPSFQNDPDETAIKGFINHAINVDPSRNQSYTLWIIRTYLKGGIRRYEDFSRLQMALNLFDKFKSKLSIKDLGQIKSLSQLEQLVDEFKDADEPISGKAQQRAYKREILNQSKMVYRGQDGIIVIPETEEASIFWGRGTRWCTAATDSENYFDYYSKTGPLYVIIHNGTKLQLHVESEQFLNDQDEEINQDDYQEFEAAKWAATKLPFEKWVIDDGFDELIQYIPNPSEDFQVALTDQDPSYIEDLNNPSEAVQLAAVSQNGYVIQFIDNPSEQVQLAAVGQVSHAIKFIDKPSERVQLAAVNDNSELVMYIKKPLGDKVQALYIKTGGDVSAIEDPSEYIQLMMINKSSFNISYINNPTPKVQLTAVTKTPFTISGIEHPTPEAQMVAVRDDPANIKYIDDPTPEVQAYVKSHNG